MKTLNKAELLEQAAQLELYNAEMDDLRQAYIELKKKELEYLSEYQLQLLIHELKLIQE